ncbi:azurin [Pseudomonas sp. 1D4]|uniref:azurin n=1 Tax=Pseudomonadaceae TaxID=135621 RepID=UPI00084AFD30|nr:MULTISPECIES: azurin [Pseudomonas]OEC46399.1 azurin [Pseudomonas sp. 1D4]OEC60036.1 azurin [Pseudomonas sp. ENNP23]
MIRKLVVASVLALASAPLLAAECAVDVEATDQMTFNTKEIKVSKSCKSFTVNLKHVGKLPKAVMGHNWVLTKTADAQSVATESMAAGVDKDYVKADDARIIAHTKLIGGGESTSVSFDVSKLAAGESYEFFCSFPGHVAMMKGNLALVD